MTHVGSLVYTKMMTHEGLGTEPGDISLISTEGRGPGDQFKYMTNGLINHTYSEILVKHKTTKLEKASLANNILYVLLRINASRLCRERMRKLCS